MRLAIFGLLKLQEEDWPANKSCGSQHTSGDNSNDVSCAVGEFLSGSCSKHLASKESVVFPKAVAGSVPSTAYSVPLSHTFMSDLPTQAKLLNMAFHVLDLEVT